MADMRVKLILELVDRLVGPVRRMADKFSQSCVKMMLAAEKLREKVIKIGEAAQKIGQQLSMKISLPITALGVASVRTAANFESLMASLETATGSSAKAQEAFNMISKFAATTPFELQEVLTGFIKLTNLGLNPTIETLTSFGNTASAMGKSLDQFVEAVADATTGEFERLKEFGIKTSVEGKKVTFTFRGMKTTVKNNATEIQKYLQQIGDVQFAGGMERQSATFNGIMSNLSDSVDASLSKIGNSVIKNLDLKDFFKDLGNAITWVGEAFAGLPTPVQKFIIVAAVVLAIIGPAIIAIAQFAIGIATLAYTFTLLMPAMLATIGLFKTLSIALLTTPIGWIIMGVTALAVAVFLIYKNWAGITDFFKGVWNSIKELFESGVNYALDVLQPLLDAVNYVRNGISSIAGRISGNPVTANMPNLPSNRPSSGSAATAAPPSVLRNQVDTGGTLNIKIDSTGAVSSVMARPNDKSMDFQVDTGLMMGVNYGG